MGAGLPAGSGQEEGLHGKVGGWVPACLLAALGAGGGLVQDGGGRAGGEGRFSWQPIFHSSCHASFFSCYRP